MNDRQRSLLRLSLIKGIGPSAIRKLIEQYPDPQQALESSPAELMERCCFLSTSQASSIARAIETVDITPQLESIQSFQARLICLGDLEYPPLLQKISNPPAVLYCRGSQPFPQAPTLSIVGSRDCTAYAERKTVQLLEQLAKKLPELVIVSGLARGVDSVSHEYALKFGLRTVAVLGSGVDFVYPIENTKLAERIYAQGAVLSEYPMATPPYPHNFPTRNRIISGLAGALAVMEAGSKSGALITAGFSQNYNRPVFSLPGDVDRTFSEGTNYLVKSGQARMLLDPDEIVAAVIAGAPPTPAGVKAPVAPVAPVASTTSPTSTASPVASKPSTAQYNPASDLNGEKAQVISFLSHDSMHPNEIYRSSDIPMERLLGLLLELELSGSVYCDENSLYRLVS